MSTYTAGEGKIAIHPDFEKFVEELRGELDAVDAKFGVTIEPRTAEADQKIARWRESAGRNLDTKVEADTKAAQAEVDKFRAEQESKPVKVPVETDSKSLGATKTKLAKDLSELKGGLREGLELNMKIVGVAGAASAVSELLAIADAAAQAMHAIDLLPAAGFGLLAGGAALKIGTHGISSAFQAISAADADPAGNAIKQRDALDGLAEAQYRVGEAQRSVQTAQREELLDQRDLNDAYRDASRSLRDMNLTLEDQKLNVTDASIAVREAAKNMQKVQFDPTADADTRQRAVDDYQHSVIRLQEAQNKQNDMAQDTARANQLGVDGAKDVVAAKQKVIDGVQAEANAAHELQQAYVAVQKAQEQVNDATGQNKINAALAKLSPDAQTLVHDLRELGPTWKDLRFAAQDALTDGLGTSITHLADTQLPTLKTGLVGINTAINTGLKTSIQELTSDTNRADFATFLSNTTVGFEGLGRAAAPITDAILKLVTVGSQEFPRLGQAIDDAAGKFNSLVQRDAANGSLENRFDSAITHAEELGQTIGHIGSAFGSILHAAGDAGAAIDAVTGKFATFLKGVPAQSALSGFFSQMRQDGEKFEPILRDLPGLLRDVIDGFQTWSAVTMPFLRAAADLLSAHPTLVEAAVASYAGFKTLSPIFTGVRGGLSDLRTAVSAVETSAGGALTGLRNITTASNGVAQVAGYGSVNLGRFGSAVQQLGTYSPAIAGMQTSFLNAAAGAERFGGTAGTAAAAVNGIRSAANNVVSAGSGLVNALGGPWVLAIAAAAAAAIQFTSELSKADEHAKQMRQTMLDIGVERSQLTDVFASNGGVFNADAITNVTNQIGIMKKSLDEAGNNRAGFFEKGKSLLDFSLSNDNAQNKDWYADRWAGAKKIIDDLKLSDQQLAETLGDTSKFADLSTKLQGMGQDGRFALSELNALRDGIVQAQQLAQDTTPGFGNLTAAVKTLSDTSATGADRLSALKNALDTLSGKSLDAQDALARYNDQVRATAQLTQQWDASQGTGLKLIDNGKVDTTTANGRKLYDALKAIRDATADAAVAGNNLDPVLAQNDTQFQQLADATGLSKQQIIDLATGIGYLPRDIKILAQLQGATDVTQQLTAINEALAANKDGITIPTDALTGETKQKLKDLGIAVDDVTGKKGEIHVTALTDDAKNKLQALIDTPLPDKTQKINIDWKLADNASPVAVLLHQALADRGVLQPSVPGNVAGGQLPTAGPGTQQRDGILAVNGAGMPIARVDGGEWVINRDRSREYDRELSQINAGTFPKLPGYETGGVIGQQPGTQTPDVQTAGTAQPSADALARVTGLDQYAQSLAGQPYGGDLDCSGLISKLALKADGMPTDAGRMATSNEGDWLQGLGFQLGLGSPGTFRVGWVNDPSMPGGGHTAGTLPNEVDIESSGSAGKVLYGGGALGYNAALFNQHAYLNMGIASVNTQAGGIGPASPDTLATSSQPNTQQVVYPQAPLPTTSMTDDQITIEEDKAAVDTANSQRNAVYANQASTPAEKHAADLAYFKAQNALKSAQTKGDQSLLSVQGIATKAASILATGFLNSFGLQDSILSDSNPWNKALNDTYNGLNDRGLLGGNGGYAYTPKNLPTTVTTVTQQPGSEVPGATQSPNGAGTQGNTAVHQYDPTQGAEQWRSTFAGVLSALGDPDTWLDPGLAQAGSESGGSPTAENDHDPDGQGGFQVVKGIMQMRDDTYAEYFAPQFPGGIFDAASNFAAATRYTVAKYGDPTQVWGHGHGYADGGWVDGLGGPRTDSIALWGSRGEFMVNAQSAADNASWLEAVNGGSSFRPVDLPGNFTPNFGASGSGATYDHSINMGDVHALNADSFTRQLDAYAARQSMGFLVTQ